MLRTKITALGRLNFLDDGGLLCSVTLHQALSLGASVCAAARLWAPTDPNELVIGGLVEA